MSATVITPRFELAEFNQRQWHLIHFAMRHSCTWSTKKNEPKVARIRSNHSGRILRLQPCGLWGHGVKVTWLHNGKTRVALTQEAARGLIASEQL